jgi:hypothetical protein
MKCPQCGAKVPPTRLLAPNSGGVTCPSCSASLRPTEDSYKYTRRREIQAALAVLLVAVAAIAISIKTGYWWMNLVTMLAIPTTMAASSRWLRQRFLHLRAV